MTSSNKKKSNSYRIDQYLSPPIKVWFYTITILLILLIISIPFYIKYLKSENTEFVRKNLKRIATFSKREDNKKTTNKSIIIIGSSLLYRATFLDKSMDIFAEKLGFKDLSFLRIARINCDIFHIKSLFNSILKASPDILMIQSDLLLFYSKQIKRNNYSHFLLFIIKKLLNIDINNKNLLKDNKKYKIRKSPSIFQANIYNSHKLWQKPISNLNFFKSFVLESQKKGIRIILYNIPRSPKFDKIRDESVKTQLLYLENIVREINIEWLVFPFKINDNLFYDFTHLTIEGRIIYSKWLISELTQLLQMDSEL